MQSHTEISLCTEPHRREVIFVQLLRETEEEFKQLPTCISAVINTLAEVPVKNKSVKYLD